MEILGTLDEAATKVLADVHRCLSRIRELSALRADSAAEGVTILRTLRRETYEDLNQIQHEHSIVEAVHWLVKHGVCPPTTQWTWNPRQTGLGTEPDLQGIHDDSIVLSAEITTSENPVGVIDTRMGKTLKKLSAMGGEKYYFVCTETMLARARTKVAKNDWPVEVVMLQ